MPKGYWIVSIDVTDADQYGEYVKVVRPFLARQNAQFLTRGGTHEITEGTSHSRNVVIEFDSYTAATAAYHSAEYQTMIPLRTKAAHSNFVIVEGLEG